MAALQLAYHVSPDLKQGNYKGVSWTILNHLQTYLQKKELVLEEFNEKYKKIIVELSTEGHYCTAANTAVALSIYDKSHVDDFLIPLLLLGSKDCNFSLHKYLAIYPDAATELMKYLDDLADYNRKKLSLLEIKYPKIPSAKFTETGNLSFRSRSLMKTVKKLAEAWNISPEVYPRISEWNAKGKIIHLIKSKSSSTLDEFRDEIIATVGHNKVLQEKVVSALQQEKDVVEAEFWENRFDLKLDSKVKEISESKDENSTNNNFLKLPIRPESLHLVDTKEKFQQFVEKLESTEETLIGLDTESKPGVQKPSLIQVALSQEVFLLDFEVLPEVLDDFDYGKLKTALFLDDNKTVVGFAVSDDVKKCAKFCKSSTGNDNFCKNIVDLQKEHNGKLSDLCMQLLGKPLNKAEQTSDWSKRPLTASKMEYAALDAWVCVELYKVKQNKEKSS